MVSASRRSAVTTTEPFGLITRSNKGLVQPLKPGAFSLFTDSIAFPVRELVGLVGLVAAIPFALSDLPLPFCV